MNIDAGLCYLTSNDIACNETGGIWDIDLQICIYDGYSPSQCSNISAIFSDCKSLSNYDCLQCENNASDCSLNQTIMQCCILINLQREFILLTLKI
jgi:hypothetical protein